MPSKIEHMIVGGIGAAILHGMYQKTRGEQTNPQELAVSAISGAIFSVLPDILEKPTSPEHRRFFHSLATLAGVFQMGKGLRDNQNINPIQKAFMIGATTGYATHIILDSLTPRGISII